MDDFALKTEFARAAVLASQSRETIERSRQTVEQARAVREEARRIRANVAGEWWSALGIE